MNASTELGGLGMLRIQLEILSRTYKTSDDFDCRLVACIAASTHEHCEEQRHHQVIPQQLLVAIQYKGAHTLQNQKSHKPSPESAHNLCQGRRYTCGPWTGSKNGMPLLQVYGYALNFPKTLDRIHNRTDWRIRQVTILTTEQQCRFWEDSMAHPLDQASLTTSVSLGGRCKTSQTSVSGSPESQSSASLFSPRY